MLKMKNETARAELGRASWKLLHTMGQRCARLSSVGSLFFTVESKLFTGMTVFECWSMSPTFYGSYRYPDHPTADEKQASPFFSSASSLANSRFGIADIQG